MHSNVSSDAVAADEDTIPGPFLSDTGLIFTATQRHSNSQLVILYYWPALFLLSFSILGVVGNLLVCLAIATERRLQNRTNWFLFSLALADMLVSGLVIPLAVVKEFVGFWTLGPILCDLWIFLDICSCTSSIMHIVVISIDRYMAINDPLNTRNRQQKCKILLLIILIWLIAILLSSPMIVLGAINPLNVFIDGQCLINNQFFVTYGSVVSFVIPLIIVIIMYTLTVRRLKEQIRQCQTQLAQEQLARAASLVAKPFLRRHIPTRQAAAAAAAAAATISTLPTQSTPKSTAALRRLRLQRQQTSLELSEESLENSSSQNAHKQSPIPRTCLKHIRQLSDQNSQCDEQQPTNLSRDINRQIPTKFSPHTEYACPKNPFCQLKCTCHQTSSPSRPSDHQTTSMETLPEQKSSWNCCSLLCCSKSSISNSCFQRHSSLKSNTMSASTTNLPHQSNLSLNRTTFSHKRGRTWRRLTISPASTNTRTKSSAVRNEQKAVKVLGVVFVIFVIAWFPFCIMNLLQGVCKRCSINENILNGFVWLGYVSSTINPVVYTIFNRNFRLKFIALLKCHCSHVNPRHRHFAYYRNHSSLQGSRFKMKAAPTSGEPRRLDPFREEKDLHLIETTLPE